MFKAMFGASTWAKRAERGRVFLAPHFLSPQWVEAYGAVPVLFHSIEEGRRVMGREWGMGAEPVCPASIVFELA